MSQVIPCMLCQTGYAGENCEITRADCSNNGNPSSNDDGTFTCTCDSDDYSGNICQFTRRDNCNDHGNPKTDSAGGTRGTSLSHCECDQNIDIDDDLVIDRSYYGTICEHVLTKSPEPSLPRGTTADGRPGDVNDCNGNGAIIIDDELDIPICMCPTGVSDANCELTRADCNDHGNPSLNNGSLECTCDNYYRTYSRTMGFGVMRNLFFNNVFHPSGTIYKTNSSGCINNISRYRAEYLCNNVAGCDGFGINEPNFPFGNVEVCFKHSISGGIQKQGLSDVWYNRSFYLKKPYKGSLCQYTDLIECNNNGSVNDYGMCTCDIGNAGDNCEFTRADCNNRGNPSSNDDGSLQCTCDSGYSGPACEITDVDCQVVGVSVKVIGQLIAIVNIVSRRLRREEVVLVKILMV